MTSKVFIRSELNISDEECFKLIEDGKLSVDSFNNKMFGKPLGDYKKPNCLLKVKESLMLELLDQGKISPVSSRTKSYAQPAYSDISIGTYLKYTNSLVGEIGLFLKTNENDIQELKNRLDMNGIVHNNESNYNTDAKVIFVPFFNTDWDKENNTYQFKYIDLAEFIEYVKIEMKTANRFGSYKDICLFLIKELERYMPNNEVQYTNNQDVKHAIKGVIQVISNFMQSSYSNAFLVGSRTIKSENDTIITPNLSMG